MSDKTSTNTGEFCELCEVELSHNFHHLIPRTLHSNKWFKKRYDRHYMATYGLNVCWQCHKMIHKIIPNEKELGKKYNTKEKLLAHPKIKQYVEWKQR